jgi:hypothetical protein
MEQISLKKTFFNFTLKKLKNYYIKILFGNAIKMTIYPFTNLPSKNQSLNAKNNTTP